MSSFLQSLRKPAEALGLWRTRQENAQPRGEEPTSEPSTVAEGAPGPARSGRRLPFTLGLITMMLSLGSGLATYAILTGLTPIVVSFEPLPRAFFSKEPVPRLSSVREKLLGFDAAGVGKAQSKLGSNNKCRAKTRYCQGRAPMPDGVRSRRAFALAVVAVMGIAASEASA